MESSLQNRIRERAYELWNAGGRIDGHAEQYWLAAERELLGEMAAQLPAAFNVPRDKRARPKLATQRRKSA
jgi:Protein of unknown function (DUF2934)